MILERGRTHGRARIALNGNHSTASAFAGDFMNAGAALVALTLLFTTTDTLFPTHLPLYATSASQITGMALMLILVPTFLLVALSISKRRSLELIQQLVPLLPNPEEAEIASESIRGATRRTWKIGTAIGITFGLMNTESIAPIAEGPALQVAASISLGQLVLWWLIGLVMVMRVESARAFRRLGESVSFDLFRLDDLRPLARAGLIDVVIIAGALLLTPLQSLDAEFRWYNYRFALVVALPAASFFLLWPLRGVGTRIKLERDSKLRAVDAQLRDAQGTVSAESISKLETLLAHRDRLRRIGTTPLSTKLLSRVLFYLVFPPLAWAGAALVERMLERALSG